MNSDEKISRVFYFITVLILILCIGVCVTLRCLGISLEDFLTTVIGPCIIRENFGIYCPGCGGARSVVFLLTGNFLESFLYHPFTIYATIMLLLLVIIGTLSLLTKGKIHMPKIRPIYLYLGAGIIIIQWIVKLVALLVFKTLLIPF